MRWGCRPRQSFEAFRTAARGRAARHAGGIAGSIIVTDMNNTDANSLPMALDYLTGWPAAARSVLIMSDIPSSPMPDWELYGKVGAMVRSAGIGRFVGVGERISACRDAFGAGERVLPHGGRSLSVTVRRTA